MQNEQLGKQLKYFLHENLIVNFSYNGPFSGEIFLETLTPYPLTPKNFLLYL